MTGSAIGTASVAEPLRAPAPPPAYHPGSTAAVWSGVLLVFLAVTASVAAIRALGAITGWGALVLLAILLLLLPTAKSFSLRVMLSLIFLAGTAPLMWWIKLDLPFVDRGSALLALTAGALAGSLAHTAFRRGSFRRFLPEFRSVDLLPLVAAVVSAWTVQSFIFTKTLNPALSIMTRAWDFAPHFNMFNMIRTHGAAIPVLGPAFDGSQWTAASYPQGYHSLLATLAELVAGTGAGDPGAEATLFLRLVGIVTVLGTVLVIASLTALPVFRRRLVLSLPFIALATTAWTVGPGSIPVFGAFPNFGLGVALCVAVLVLVQLARIHPPTHTSLALALALAAVAHGWILLLVLCLPAAVGYGIYLLSLRPQMGTRALAMQILILSTGAAGVFAALWQLRKLSAGEVLTLEGGIHRTDTGMAVAVLLINAVVLLALLAGRRTGPSRARKNGPAPAVLATPLYGAGLLIVLAAYQLATSDEITYYFHKSFLAVELLAIMCTIIGAGQLLIPRLSLLPGSKALPAACLLTTLAATHVYGLPYASLHEKGIPATALGTTALLGQQEVLKEPALPIVGKLAAMTELRTGRPYVYVGYNEGFDPQLAAQWSLALQGAWSEGTEPAVAKVRPLYQGPNRVPAAIDPILRTMPDLDVMVDPWLVAELRAWRPEYAERIISWQQ